MLQSILMMGGLGVLIGTVLVIASKAFYVYEDPKVLAIDDVLPGANCGGCGYPGCNANAEAIVNGVQDVNSCVAAGEDVAMAIAEIMGVSVSDTEPEFAGPGCYYSKDEADMEFRYQGITDCRAAAMMFGGMKVCRIGCLGLGTCVNACMFDALSIGEDGLPKVDQEKCTGCGACERICPKNIIRLTSVTRRIMREYTLDECITPCQRACPTGIDIKEYIRLIREGDYEGSVQVIKERNPFPTVISRICPALCESNCRRLFQDESVGINDLKRFVCDYEMNLDKRVLPYKAPATDKKVAIIGGGVEGLSAAFFTARLGHAPTVLEATDKLGGILRKAISRERLDMSVLDWDVEGVREMGVDITTQKKAGKDFTINSLIDEGFDAVFTATGGWDSRLARNGAGEAESVFPGAFLLIDVLRSASDSAIQIHPKGHAVIAGGSTGLDKAVEILKAKGATNVTVVIRKSESDPALDTQALKAAKDLGASIVYGAGITMVHGEKENLTGIEYTELSSGIVEKISADTLVIGSGRFPELVFVPIYAENEEADNADSKQLLGWKGVELLKKPDADNAAGLLSNQDVISEYTSAVGAINGGRKAAAAIHNLMYNIDFQETGDLMTERSPVQDVDRLIAVDTSSRNIMQVKQIQKGSSDNFSTGFSNNQAQTEAERCLRCGLVCYERSKEAVS